MLKDQKDKFSLEEDVVYLNTSYMAPALKEVEAAGVMALKDKSRPYNILPVDFFDPVTELKKLFARLINVSDFNSIACIPSVSYGIATVTNNIKLKPGDEIVLVEDQFPSNYYSWEKLAKSYNAELKIVKKPKTDIHTAEEWNTAILNSISEKTAVVAMAHVHWADGTLFDLLSIRKKTKLHGALLIIDGTQSVGAFPFSVAKIQPDALICANYKWLLGPYALGLAYFGEYFNNGTPIEESWVNRVGSEDFAGLTNYSSTYKEKANRYCMGESANFISVPMAIKALEQIIDWSTESIQDYCHNISKDALEELQTLGFIVEDIGNRGAHLVGIKAPPSFNIPKLKEQLINDKIYISYRGNYIRIAIHLFNTKEDLNKLVRNINSII